MTEWDPNAFRDRRPGPDDEPLELPLEMFFAEDRGDPEARAAGDALASDVLSRVESQRGFVSGRERGLIRASRGVLLAGAVCVLLAAAVVDRLGLAPWSPEPVEGPVSSLVSSTSQRTAGKIEQVRELRDQLLRAVNRPSAEKPWDAGVVAARPVSVQRLRVESAREPVSGPYLTAEGFGSGTPSTTTVTTVIRFEDGFSVPVMAGEKPSELRWPASRDVTSSFVTLEGGASASRLSGLSPAWYAKRSTGPSR